MNKFYYAGADWWGSRSQHFAPSEREGWKNTGGAYVDFNAAVGKSSFCQRAIHAKQMTQTPELVHLLAAFYLAETFAPHLYIKRGGAAGTPQPATAFTFKQNAFFFWYC